jgi:uncharacterized coiled-coil DUF342 family protein
VELREKIQEVLNKQIEEEVNQEITRVVSNVNWFKRSAEKKKMLSSTEELKRDELMRRMVKIEPALIDYMQAFREDVEKMVDAKLKEVMDTHFERAERLYKDVTNKKIRAIIDKHFI